MINEHAVEVLELIRLLTHGVETVKVGLTCWNQRIAPVFDVSREILVVEIEAGCVVGHSRQVLPPESGWLKAKRVKEMGINIFICGAISRPMHDFIISQGIEVWTFIAGDLQEVIDAWIQGNLSENSFAMPGCGRNRRRRRCRAENRFKHYE